MRPIETRFGLRGPRRELALAALCELWGETIVPNGGDAANWLGLTTQNTVRSVYLTSGPNRILHFGAHRVELLHAPSWQLAAPNRNAGTVIRAVAWLGPREVEKSLDAVLPQALGGRPERTCSPPRPVMPQVDGPSHSNRRLVPWLRLGSERPVGDRKARRTWMLRNASAEAASRPILLEKDTMDRRNAAACCSRHRSGDTSCSRVARRCPRSGERSAGFPRTSTSPTTFVALPPILVVGGDEEALPPTRSQERRWTRAIRPRLAEWVRETASPLIAASACAHWDSRRAYGRRLSGSTSATNRYSSHARHR